MAVDVTRDNFAEALPRVADALDRCAFWALDLEMTGLFTDGRRHEYLDDVQSRYAKVAEAAQRYCITQVGLSCFEAVSPAPQQPSQHPQQPPRERYHARTFNFYVFPEPHGGGAYNKKFLCDAASLSFLAAHGFDFTTCFSRGVPFMPARTRDHLLAQAARDYSQAPRSAAAPAVPTAPEDVAFVEDLVRLVRAWLAGDGDAAPSASLASDGGAGAVADASSDEEAGAAVVQGGDDEAAAAAVAAAAEAAAARAVAAATAAAAGNGGGDAYERLVLPPMNGWRRLLAYQELRKPQFTGGGGGGGSAGGGNGGVNVCGNGGGAGAAGGDGGGNGGGEAAAAHTGFWITKLEGDARCLVLVRADAARAAALEAEARAAKLGAITAAAGFTAVMDLIGARPDKPGVVHNGLFDCAYTLASFGDPSLPASWRDFKRGPAKRGFPAGLFDTKHLAGQLPEVFAGCGTGLSDVRCRLAEAAAAVDGDGANGGGEGEGAAAAVDDDGDDGDGAIRALLAAASAAAGAPVRLPLVEHAPGFDKYRGLAPGEAAHEAGFDAFMTGAAFACLLPLLRGKVAAEPSCELARAAAAAEAAREAVAAAAAAAAPATSPPPAAAAAGAAEQQQRPVQEQQQQQQQQPEQQQRWRLDERFAAVAGAVGRLNVTFSDIPYAALDDGDDDPIPARPHVYHLAGLRPGLRPDELARALQRAGLGQARVAPVDATLALVEFAPEHAPRAAEVLAAAAAADAAAAAAGAAAANGNASGGSSAALLGGVVATPWSEWAPVRYGVAPPPPPAAAAAAAAGGAGGVVDIGPGSAAVDALAGVRRAAAGVKRGRAALQAETAAAAAAALMETDDEDERPSRVRSSSMCAIM